tara:strand:- start:463 stop:633 length:171 start_codon:yes stop_codon:yes gene_type:complete
MKYNELDSTQRANYWALMSLVQYFHDFVEEDDPKRELYAKSVVILQTNLHIELFTD